MITLEVNDEEAGRLLIRPDRDEWRQVHFSDRGTTEWRDSMRHIKERGITGVTFRLNEDDIVWAKVHDCWAPFDYLKPESAKADCWGIEYEGATWRRIPPDNSGYWQHRIADHVPDQYALIERALAEQWKHDNEETAGRNYGMGILQDLMLSTLQHENPKNFNPWLSNRERKIVATVIQWLGTNVGRSFLYEASRRMGRPRMPFEAPVTPVEGKEG